MTSTTGADSFYKSSIKRHQQLYCVIKMSTKKVTEHIETAEEQMELFLWKYRDISREEVRKMYNVSDVTCVIVLPTNIIKFPMYTI